MTIITSVDILKLAQTYVAVPEGWCQGPFASDANGKEVEAIDPTAVSYCILGAMQKAQHELERRHGIQILSHVKLEARKIFQVANNFPFGKVGEWNDRPTTTHHDVVKAFRCAIDHGSRMYIR